MELLGAMGRPCGHRNRLPTLVLPLQVSLPLLSSQTAGRNPDIMIISLTPPSCITARRRRKAGRTPFYGTGWAARPTNGNNTAQPYYNNNYNSAPAPPYSAATNSNNNGYYGNGANQSYYGQQNGVELQSPQPTYGGNNQYAPPPGPPPGKDGIIR